MTIKSAGNAIAQGRFPVRTYMVGKCRVIDRQVHAEYLRQQQEFYASERKAGLRELAAKRNK